MNEGWGYLVLATVFIIIIYVVWFLGHRSCMGKSLRERQIFYSILNKVDFMIVMWKDDLSSVNMNQYMKTWLGYEMQDNDRQIFKKLFSIDEKNCKDKADEMLFTMQNSSQEIHCKDGELKNIIWRSIITSINTEHTRLIFTLGIDVTEAIQREKEIATYIKKLEEKTEEIQLLEEKQEVAIENANIILIYKTIDSDIIYMPEACKSLIGFSKQVILKKDFHARIHRKDLGEYLNYIEAVKKGDDSSKDCKIRLRMANGKYNWYLIRYKSIKNKEGSPIRFAGALININEGKAKDEIIEKLAFEDELTGLSNKRKFFIETKTLLKNSLKKDQFCMMYIDILGFSFINNVYGNKVGDLVLKKVGIIIKNLTKPKTLCCRTRDDEFLILFPIKNERDIKEFYELLESRVENIKIQEKVERKLEIIAGATIYTKHSSDIDTLYENLTFVMDDMKIHGKTGLQIFDEGLKQRMLDKEDLYGELKKAIKEQEFIIYYQPKVDIHTEKVVGMEALIRWEHPKKGFVSPEKFIPLAEETNLIIEIGKWVLQEVCEQSKKWQDKGYKDVAVSFNMSSLEFYQSNIVEYIEEVLRYTGVEPSRIKIELTETMALIDVNQTIQKIKDIQALGIKIELDDFGTGYSSLGYLKTLPINTLKLDRSFILDIEKDELSRNIIKTIIQLAKFLKLNIIAEGVESKEQVELLRSMGCDIIQGYYYGKPVPAETFEKIYLTPSEVG